MAGIFTHLAAVISIYGNRRRLSAAVGDGSLRYAIAKYTNYVDLGSISPDSPYLYWLNFSANSRNWGNLMHYCLPGDFIREGIRFLYHNDKLNEEDKRKATAWLFGYTSHVVMDLTVHPVVERKVGTYDDNEWEHKRCESQQDAYIFPKTTKIEITEANYLRGAGLRSCIDEDTEELHGLTAAIWTHCAKSIKKKSKATKYSRPRPLRNPNPQDWFGWFCTLLDRVVEEGHHIPIISRGTQALGITCPRKEDIDMTFVENLELPDGTKAHFEDVFERGRSNVMHYWGELSDALISKNAEKFTLPNGNLDTGRVDELNAEKADDTTKFIFWQNQGEDA